MEQRQLGRLGPRVSAIGLGCMSLGIADVYTSSVRDDDDAVALIRRALDLGMTFLDTADIYGDSELKVGKAVKGRRQDVALATKFGFVQQTVGQAQVINGRPEYVRQACERSLQRLEVDDIDVYYLHRVDPKVPIEETVGAMAGLVQEGKVRHLGLSEVSPSTLRRAHRVHPIAAVQTEDPLFSREPEDELLPTLKDLGAALVAYSPLGRGFLAGRFRTLDDLAPDDWRRGNPRFQGGNFERNVALADRVREMAVAKVYAGTARTGLAAHTRAGGADSRHEQCRPDDGERWRGRRAAHARRTPRDRATVAEGSGIGRSLPRVGCGVVEWLAGPLWIRSECPDVTCGRGDWIRTSDPLRPRQVRYQAALRPDSEDLDFTAVLDGRPNPAFCNVNSRFGG